MLVKSLTKIQPASLKLTYQKCQMVDKKWIISCWYDQDYLISWPCIYWWMLQLTNLVAATWLFIQFTTERSVFTQSFIHKKFHLEWVSEQLLNDPLSTHNRSFRGRSFQAVSLHWYWQQK